VRLVDNKNVIVAVEHRHGEGNCGLTGRQWPVGPEGKTTTGGHVGGNAVAVIVNNGAGGKLCGKTIAGAVEAF